jgi:hypothetical protein
MISFCKPCLNWKFIQAYKGHSGWNSFIAPFQNKYLHRLERRTTATTQDGAPPQVDIEERSFTIDRLDSIQLNSDTISPRFPFPFNAPPGTGDPGWIVRDDYYSHTFVTVHDAFHNFTITILIEVFLSNPYTLAQLDADTDALINSINPDTLPWGTVTPIWYPDTEFGAAFGGLATHWAEFALQNFIPAPYQLTLGFDPVTVPFVSAAGYAYAFNPFRLDPLVDGSPEGYTKWVGFIKLAGKYCRKTFLIDYNQRPIGNPTCQSGLGSCATYFKIIPPPLTLGQNAYVLIQPNCQCA